MNPLIQFKTTTLLPLIALTFACFGPSPSAQAAPSPSNVNVVNTASVRDVDNAARRSFTASVSDTFIWSDLVFDAPLDVTTVPVGKRLVIEQVSVIALTDPSANQKVFAWIETTNGGTVSKYYFAGTDVGMTSAALI